MARSFVSRFHLVKRLILPGLVLLAVLALLYWGNRIIERTLDAELPGLLSRELGIPVTLGPTRAWAQTLTVRSPRLVMGDPANPALVATKVMVSLDWADLLHGEIRLRRATGDKLVVKPSLWPGNDDPWPTDYRFLDPYLPDYMELGGASYVSSDGASYEFKQPQWRRRAPGASLSWQAGTDGQAVGINAVLGSLDDLLRLAPLKLELTVAVPGSDESVVTASAALQPGEQSGYSLAVDIGAAGMTAQVVTGNTSAWASPDQSSIAIKQLDIAKVRALAKIYRGESDGEKPEALLALALPRLSLPTHKGRVTIAKIHAHDEVLTDTTFDFSTGPDGLRVPALSSNGPASTLQGQIDIVSSDAGWQVGLTAGLQAAAPDTSLGAPYLGSHWLWREGSATLAGQGATWGSLLNSLQGDIALGGSHHGTAETQVNITAKLDNRPGEFALDMIDLKFGDGRITGSAALSGDEQKRLSATVRTEHLNLDFLLPAADPAAPPGMELPTYLQILPGVELDWQLELADLTFGAMKLSSGSLSFERTPEQASLTARAGDGDGGKLDLKLGARVVPGKPTAVELRTDLSNLSLARLFGQAPLLADTRTSGSITFASQGTDLEQIFEAMKGVADLSLDHRPDRDWHRPPAPGKQLQVSGEATLVLQNKRITGLQISRLAIDSALQNLTGSVSIVEGRKPWLEADLTSDRLDLDSLRNRNATDAPAQSKTDSLSTLRQLGESRLSLHAKSVLIADQALGNVALQVATAPDRIDIEQLDFSLDQGSLTSQGSMNWQKGEAALAVNARVTDFRLDKLLPDAPAAASVPLSGTVTLRSSGNTVVALLGGLSGDIRLATGPAGSSADPHGEIDVAARQTADGVYAQIRHFQWEGTDLAGSLEYHATTPPLLEVEISGGSLSLLPWESVDAAEAKDADKPDTGSVVTRTARASVGLIGDVVMAPLRLISGPREAAPGEKLFSNAPMPFDWLKKYEARVKGRLGTLTSREGRASDLEFSANLIAGQLSVEVSAGAINQGSAAATMTMDIDRKPATLALNGTFRNMRGALIKAGFPRSGYFDVTSQGQSQAELAANVNGLVYLELGAGPVDFSNMMLLTADVATNVFQTLIPGVDKKQPLLECAVTLGVFKDGIGSTPYGYAARTNLANLVGKVELNLKQELIRLNFSSSSRQGLGFSIGNVFSNTVAVEGPLTNPNMIPDATGLLWRSWAAVMTGGLSVVGESVLKRALASENPCLAVQTQIRRDICGTSQRAATSSLVCPPT